MSDGKSKQVFQSLSPKRWKSFVWSFRLIIFLFVTGFAVAAIDLYFIPEFMDEKSLFKRVLDPDASFTIQNRHNTNYKNDRSRFSVVNSFNCSNCSDVPVINKSQAYLARDVRAAYYVNWDPQSKVVLNREHNKVNMLLPEWLFINPDGIA